MAQVTMEEMMRRHMIAAKYFAEERHKAAQMFNDALYYDLDKLAELARMGREIVPAEEEIPMPSDEILKKKVEVFRALRLEILAEKKKDAPEKIWLWPEGVLPQLTVYTENPGLRYTHDPDFIPYMYPVLVPENITPKGALILCAGGDHGEPVFRSVDVASNFVKKGYQCFLLLNRTNHNPWSGEEAGVDAARAIRIIRADAEKYRIDPAKIAFAGFSNGGLTGEKAIEFYSGNQTVQSVFPDYTPDEMDGISADMAAFLCIYGPRFANAPFKWDGVVYPPTFFAVGRLDSAMVNFEYVYPDLLAHNVPVEVHTFAGTPHGMAGCRRMDGCVKYPNFELWEELADYFLMDVFKGYTE